MMLSVLDMYYQEIKKNKVKDDNEDVEDNLDATITRINNSEDDCGNKMHGNLRASVLLLLKQIPTDESTNQLEPLKDC
jgi:hypothetical protein